MQLEPLVGAENVTFTGSPSVDLGLVTGSGCNGLGELLTALRAFIVDGYVSGLVQSGFAAVQDQLDQPFACP
jgi:hypothetical protein